MVFVAQKSGPSPEPENDFMLPDGLTMLRQIELEDWAEVQTNNKIASGEITTLKEAVKYYWETLYDRKETETNGTRKTKRSNKRDWGNEYANDL